MERIPFFSIVVPAHNEEAYIGQTLEKLCALEYPKDFYEVIVVENGSDDATLMKAREFEHGRDTPIKVFTCKEPGVSRARNMGSTKVRSDADWVFFLDADTFPDPPFLRSFLRYLDANASKKFVVGTVSLGPYPSTIVMRVIYAVTNVFFSFSGAAYGGALLIRRELLESISFEEDIHVGEEASLITCAKRKGRYFFFYTAYAHTSTRRFQNGGWKKIPIWIGMWIFAMIVPNHASISSSIHRRFKYKAVR